MCAAPSGPAAARGARLGLSAFLPCCLALPKGLGWGPLSTAPAAALPGPRAALSPLAQLEGASAGAAQRAAAGAAVGTGAPSSCCPALAPSREKGPTAGEEIKLCVPNECFLIYLLKDYTSFHPEEFHPAGYKVRVGMTPGHCSTPVQFATLLVGLSLPDIVIPKDLSGLCCRDFPSTSHPLLLQPGHPASSQRLLTDVTKAVCPSQACLREADNLGNSRS